MGISVAAARAPQSTAETRSHSRAWMFISIVERALAFMLLIALSPALLLTAVAVTVLSGRPPFVSVARAGWRGKRIWLLKLRTMWGDGDLVSSGGRLVQRIEYAHVPETKTQDDPRVTSAFAAFCRKYSIDELPQLWNVLHGEMALVGPRPLTDAELESYYGYDAEEVLSVKPGLTGLWQVRGRNSLTYRQRLEMDLYLVRNWSPRLYCSVMASTIPAVLSGRNAG